MEPAGMLAPGNSRTERLTRNGSGGLQWPCLDWRSADETATVRHQVHSKTRLESQPLAEEPPSLSASAAAAAASRSRPSAENQMPRLVREAARSGRYRSG